MSSEAAIQVDDLGKCYRIYDKPRDRLLQMLFRGRRQYGREFWALNGINFRVMPGEVVGIIGKNGSGKSTLLQLVCGTLAPTGGTITVRGRVAALLELGAGFNPEFSGRENVFLSAAVTGMSPEEIAARFDRIVDFSGIREFIDQPVKTYSSGMYVRLAFSIAIHVDPDILVIDEALSVGDGEFARKSFDRIMAMKAAGKTILFCSHVLYQVESFCDRVLWLDRGQCVLQGAPQEVISRYNTFLLADHGQLPESPAEPVGGEPPVPEQPVAPAPVMAPGQGCFTAIEIAMDGVAGRHFRGRSGESELAIRLRFYVDPALPPPVVGVTIDYGSIVAVSSVVSRTDDVLMQRDDNGHGVVEITFPRLPLRKGEYWISVYLGCENAVHLYDYSTKVATFEMVDSHPEPGLTALPHHWRTHPQGEIPAAGGEDPTIPLPWGHRIKTDPGDSLGLRHGDGAFEPAETALCLLLVKSGDRVLDIGANIGYYTLLFSHLVAPAGQVTAIEPDPENSALLRQNIAINGVGDLVVAHQLALGSSVHSARLFRAEQNTGMHRLYASACCGRQSTDVSVCPGDSLDLAPLDFIKIDIEGYEPVALKGLAATLARSPKVKILCEYSPLSIWEAGTSPVVFLEEMCAAGFHLLTLQEKRWVATSFAEMLDEVRKIPEAEAIEFIRRFEPVEDVRAIFDKSVAFLAACEYGRPVLENVLFVAPKARQEVGAALERSSRTVDIFAKEHGRACG